MEVRNAVIASLFIAAAALAVLLLPQAGTTLRVVAGIGLSLAFALNLLAMISWHWQDRAALAAPQAQVLVATDVESDSAALAG